MLHHHDHHDPSGHDETTAFFRFRHRRHRRHRRHHHRHHHDNGHEGPAVFVIPTGGGGCGCHSGGIFGFNEATLNGLVGIERYYTVPKAYPPSRSPPSSGMP